MHVYFVAIFAQACIRCFIDIAPLALLSALQLVLLMTDIAYKCECGKYFWNKTEKWSKEEYKVLWGRFSQHAFTCAPLQRQYGDPRDVSQWPKKLENKVKPGIYNDDGEFVRLAPAPPPSADKLNNSKASSSHCDIEPHQPTEPPTQEQISFGNSNCPL